MHSIQFKSDEFYDHIVLMEVIERTVQPEKVASDSIKDSKKGVIVTIPKRYLKERVNHIMMYGRVS